MAEQKKRNRRVVIRTVLVTLLIVAGIMVLLLKAGGFSVVKTERLKKQEKVNQKYMKLYEIQRLIDEEYLWKSPTEKEQMELIYRTLTNELGDKYSRYLNEEEVKELKSKMNGSFTGLGIVVADKEGGGIKVIDLIEDGPAMSAGVKKGDIIVSVDGKKYSNSLDFSRVMRGKPGTSSVLGIKRNGKIKEIRVVRGEIEESTVEPVKLKSGIGYIRIKSFGDETGLDFKEAVKNMETDGTKGIIIDLRGNPGGLFDQGIEVADTLLPEGLITVTENKNGEKKKYNSDAKHTSLKYVLLIDRNTASSAEVLAAAVKENGGGPIVGETSYGKGIVQETEIFKDNTGICITTMEYFGPGEVKIQEKGVEPDYKVKRGDPSKEDLQMKKAIELLKK